MSRVRTRLEEYKAEIEKKSQYKHGLPGSALDIVNTLLNDLEQDEKEVVEQLENRSVLARPVGWSKSYEIIMLKDAVEIVKGGGVE